MTATIIYGIVNGLIIGLIALAFQINFKIYKMLDLSLAGIYVVASYFVILFNNIFNFQSFIITLLFSIFTVSILVFILSVLVYYFIYQKFIYKKVSSLTLLVLSLSVYIILINLISIIFGSDIKIFEIKGVLRSSNELGVLVLSNIQIFQITMTVIAIIITLYILQKKSIGKKITAIFDNPELFSTLGNNISKARISILIMSSLLITLASTLKTLEFGIEPYSTGFNMLLLGAVAMLIGGVQSYKGAIFGGIFLGIITNLSSWYFNGEWKYAVTFLILILILVFKKNGVFNVNLREAK